MSSQHRRTAVAQSFLEVFRRVQECQQLYFREIKWRHADELKSQVIFQAVFTWLFLVSKVDLHREVETAIPCLRDLVWRLF